jgi:hypothetical protein
MDSFQPPIRVEYTEALCILGLFQPAVHPGPLNDPIIDKKAGIVNTLYRTPGRSQPAGSSSIYPATPSAFRAAIPAGPRGPVQDAPKARHPGVPGKRSSANTTLSTLVIFWAIMVDEYSPVLGHPRAPKLVHSFSPRLIQGDNGETPSSGPYGPFWNEQCREGIRQARGRRPRTFERC